MMRRLVSIHLLLLLQTFFSAGSSRFHEVCAKNDHIGEWQYTHLFSRLEDALLNNKIVINILRQMFMGTENIEIHFSVQLEVVNGINLSSSCDNDPYYNSIPSSSFDTFCPSNFSDYKWKLCKIPEKYGSNSLEIIYTSQSLSKIQSQISKKKSQSITVLWMSFLLYF